MVLLDEIGGLVGQLELEREAARARIVGTRPPPLGASLLRQGPPGAMSSAEVDLPLLARSLLALAAVMALLLAARWILARQGLGAMASPGRGGGLHIAQTLPLDARNRLVVIRRGNAELVLAIGPQGITRLEFVDAGRAVSSRRGHPLRDDSDACAAAVMAAAAAGLVLGLAGAASAQSINVDLGQSGGTVSGQILRLVMLVTVLSLAPSILVMVTSFTRIVIVLSFLRTAIGLQQTPPNSVLVGLALFLTLFVMSPTLEAVYREGLEPLLGRGDRRERGADPGLGAGARLHAEAGASRRPRAVRRDRAAEPVPALAETPLRVLLPAFMISELRRAFEIGFLIFLPFLIIDMVVASILMSMGMMMLPPVMISLPFKLIFFVLVDGWALVVGSLVQSFGTA